ncbi:MAG: signal peptide peptidase SppA [Candidatus Electryonea clarkiae]|nr:signal peptide peptidase SppA [Candidatus Electryonea clarkiae]MDP8288364.1 signal peptide peptidase SppA [Candidatus Electryonea clarkiae]
MNRKGRSDAIAAFVLIGGLIIIILIASMAFRQPSGGSGIEMDMIRGDRVGLVDIIGPIYDARRWCEQIDAFRLEEKVKAIVIRIDSPGGGVAASQELYSAISRARKAKPVIASLGSVAASGGYYAAIGADTIVANPGTTTGSIGVLMELTQFYELMEKIGIDAEMIKSGEYKDTGWPFRDLTAKDRKYLQNYVDDAYDQFTEAVALERNMEIEQVKKVADGRVFTGRQAHELGLIDLIGDQYEAIRIAGEISGLGEEPKIAKPPKKHPIDWLDELLDESVRTVQKRLESQPKFQYRWRPE